MHIQTKYHGTMEIVEKDLISFPHGLPGFQTETSFLIMDLQAGGLFQVLQSTQTPDLAFVVANPYQFNNKYSFELDEAILDLLKIKDQEEVAVFVIVTVKDPFVSSTVNMKAPVVVNVNKKLAKQYILATEAYQTKTPITEGD